MDDATHLPPPVIRPFRPGDERAAYHVCLQTGDRGDDGTAHYAEDPEALGRIYVGPYLRFEPDLALMLEDDDGVCGYILGALDSRAFYDRYEREWRAPLCRQYPHPVGDPQTWSRLAQVYRAYHEPDYFCPEPYDLYPSHLHIDLLPRAQRQGNGRRLMQQLLTRLRAKGAPGVHLGLNARNHRAWAFYQALGFQELTRRREGQDESIYMGRRLNEY